MELVGVKPFQILDQVRQLSPMGKRFPVDVGLEILVNDIILELEVHLDELLEDLLHRQVVDQGIGIEPLQMLVRIHEHTAPVGRKFKFIFGPLEVSLLHLLRFNTSSP